MWHCVFRRIRSLSDALGYTKIEEQSLPVELDPDLEYPGWEQYRENAETQYRSAFFDEFGGFMRNTVPDLEDCQGLQDRRICLSPSFEMRRKASAYYIVAYRSESTYIPQRVLSFGWLAWDVLRKVKSDMRFTNDRPIFVNEYCTTHAKDMQSTMLAIWKSAPTAAKILLPYCSRYKGLGNLFYILIKWASFHGLLNERLNATHICLLFVQFGLGHFKNDECAMPDNFLEQTNEISPANPTEVHDLNSQLGGIGSCLLRFFKCLSSRTFQMRDSLDFRNVGYCSLLAKGQWMELQKVRSFDTLILCFLITTFCAF
ncbi:unnamed protein product [Gongylonema pulchrum]|uniref:RNA-directed RNA polymerase n=1 Tax=Gongylonema pulchrum TaxID=637853 RepID=A0A3P7NN76_9BILA|nr:unnamed protein product [Gongylonema pulchrum]